MEGILLGDWEQPFQKLSVDQFTDLPFEKRITYLIKRRYGKLNKLSHLNDYLVIYLRQEAMANAAKADGFIALNIMHRNLSLGFVLVFCSFAFLTFKTGQIWHINTIFGLLTLLLSFLTLFQARTLRIGGQERLSSVFIIWS